jgi:hypothetical protein
MKANKKLDYLKEFSTLKLHLTRSRSGVVSLKTVGENTIAKAGGYGYDKMAVCFKELFKFLGCDVENICESKFDLFDYSIEKNNEFLQENNINYKVYYKTEINNTISFIELSKTN